LIFYFPYNPGVKIRLRGGRDFPRKGQTREEFSKKGHVGEVFSKKGHMRGDFSPIINVIFTPVRNVE
jgi:hypothetical protein